MYMEIKYIVTIIVNNGWETRMGNIVNKYMVNNGGPHTHIKKG